VTFTAEELKALDVESSKVIDLEKFVPRGDLDRSGGAVRQPGGGP
jgi:non-homologous end joining protein Ku